MPQFSWITFAQARAALYDRLADTSFWVDDEVGRYLIEALQTWNAFTAIWNASFDLGSHIVDGQTWYKLTDLPGYPRSRNQTDNDEILLMAYHLIEQGGSVGGFGFDFGHLFGLGGFESTGQFSLQSMSDALQRRRDEILQLTAFNLDEISIAGVINSRIYDFDDTVLSPIRNRFVPNVGSPITLWRNDELAFEYFSATYLQATGKLPTAWDVITGPPLQFAVNYAPPVAGHFDAIVVKVLPALTPPAPSVLGIPDDFCWVAKWGAMSDLLGSEAEKTDPERADYCLQRYKDGLKLLANSPWITLATIGGYPVDTVAVGEMDAYKPEWETNVNATSCIVTAGMDFAAISPVPQDAETCVLNVVGNAPIPLLDSDFVQVSRDTFDVILDYAEHLAAFKQGGAEFAQTKELAKNFFLAAQATNSRLRELGLFRDLLLEQGQRQNEVDPRFEKQAKEDDEA